MNVYTILFAALALGCLAAGAVEAGNCHGTKKTKAAPVAVEIEQEVTVSPGVKVRESVVVEDAPDGVTVSEKVEVSDGPTSGPIGVHATKKDARKVKRAMIGEAKAERKAAKAAKKEANAVHEAEAEAAVKNTYFK
jgi:hypothetical protein